MNNKIVEKMKIINALTIIIFKFVFNPNKQNTEPRRLSWYAHILWLYNDIKITVYRHTIYKTCDMYRS